MVLFQDGHYFCDVMRREEKRIQELCAQAERDLQDNHGEEGACVVREAFSCKGAIFAGERLCSTAGP